MLHEGDTDRQTLHLQAVNLTKKKKKKKQFVNLTSFTAR